MIFTKNHLRRVMNWAHRIGAAITISSAADPESVSHVVIIAARNTLYKNGDFGMTTLTASGHDAQKAAKAMIEKIKNSGHISVQRGDKYQDVSGVKI